MVDSSRGTEAVEVIDSFESFCAAERSVAVRLAWFLTGDRLDAEDVVHTALLKVGQRFQSLDKPAAYLRVVVLNGCRELERRRRRERARAVLDVPESATWMASDVELLSVVAGLPHAFREVLILRYWLDLDDSEIARAAGIRPGTVRTRVHRALALLRREVEA